MRNITIFILLILISCGKTREEKLGITKNSETRNFLKIKYSLRDDYRDTLGKHIQPIKKYQYWQYATYYEGGSGKKYTILKEGGDLSLRNRVNQNISPAYKFGIFQGGHPHFRCNYISTIENGKINYLKTEEEFRDFLGNIDNLEEAMLLARTYDYLLDDDIRGSQYLINENGFVLHLMKIHEFPVRKESVEIEINKAGFIKTKSLGIYCEGQGCYK